MKFELQSTNEQDKFDESNDDIKHNHNLVCSNDQDTDIGEQEIREQTGRSSTTRDQAINKQSNSITKTCYILGTSKEKDKEQDRQEKEQTCSLELQNEQELRC